MNLRRQTYLFTTVNIVIPTKALFNIFVEEKISLKHKHIWKQRIIDIKFSYKLVPAEKEPIVSINSVKSNNIFLLIVVTMSILGYE